MSALILFTATILSLPMGCASLDREPILGGPCQGCEYIYDGMPDELESRARIAPAEEAGDPMVLFGTVTRADGEPAPGIIIYAYQTNAEGEYPSAENFHGTLRGWTRTDASGQYWFDTIRPGAYPNGEEAEHVHMHVLEPGKGTYYIENVMFDDDPMLTDEDRESLRQGRGGDGLAYPTRDEDEEGVWQVRRDIVLGQNVPGYE